MALKIIFPSKSGRTSFSSITSINILYFRNLVLKRNIYSPFKGKVYWISDSNIWFIGFGIQNVFNIFSSSWSSGTK